jgi:hypothetical protein
MAEAKGKAAAAAPKNGEVDELGSDARRQPSDGGEVTTNQVDLEATRKVPDERLEKLNAKNEEGHEKNMKAIEEAVKGNEDGKPDPKLGREDNGNTPRVNPDGSKTWGPPGVAGAPR